MLCDIMGKGQLCALNANRRRLENMSEEDIKNFKERQKMNAKRHYEKNKNNKLDRSREIYFKAKKQNKKLSE